MSNEIRLNEKELKIINCVRENAPIILGKTIAKRIRCPRNSWFREALARLVRLGQLRKRANGGYCISEEAADRSNATVQCRAPDGVPWYTRLLLDPWFENSWNRNHPETPWPWADDKPPFQIHWSRLRKLRTKVRSLDAPPVPGRIRAFRYKPPIGKKVWVYHGGDCQTYAAVPDVFSEVALKKQDRQLSPDGKPIISPREVAKRLGVDRTVVWKYRTKGIPWVLDEKGKPVKPDTVPAKFGNKDEQFWFEEKVDQYLKAKKALSENPGEQDGLLLQSKSGMPKIEISRLKRKKKLKLHPRIGKDKNGVTCPRQLVAAEDANGYLVSRVTNPVPSNMMTVRDLAIVFDCSVDLVRQLFEGEFTEGQVRSDYERNGKTVVQVRNGYWLHRSKAKRKWAKRYPGRPWPLDLPNGQPEASRATATAKLNGHAIAAIPTVTQTITPPAPTESASKPKQTRAKRSRAKHVQWFKWVRIEGWTFGDVRQEYGKPSMRELGFMGRRPAKSTIQSAIEILDKEWQAIRAKHPTYSAGRCLKLLAKTE